MNYSIEKLSDTEFDVIFGPDDLNEPETEDLDVIRMSVNDESELQGVIDFYIASLDQTPDYTKTLEETITEALRVIKSNHSRVLNELSGDASVEERDTWPLQNA